MESIPCFRWIDDTEPHEAFSLQIFSRILDPYKVVHKQGFKYSRISDRGLRDFEKFPVYVRPTSAEEKEQRLHVVPDEFMCPRIMGIAKMHSPHYGDPRKGYP